jgi:hypothetical protein
VKSMAILVLWLDKQNKDSGPWISHGDVQRLCVYYLAIVYITSIKRLTRRAMPDPFVSP